MTRHIKWALAYRLVCSLRRRWILLLIFISIPVLLSALFLLLKNQFHVGGGIIPPTIPDPVKRDKLLTSCDIISPIAVVPNNTLTRNLIKEVQSTFKSHRVDFGNELQFFDNPVNASSWLANLTNKTNYFGQYGFGIEFSEISNSTLSYTLRSIFADGWFTTMGYPGSAETVPGPMDNYNQYTVKGFTPLQIAINEAYSRIILGLDIPDWLLQAFPYPSYEKQNDYSLLYMAMGYMNSYGLTFILTRFAIMMIQEKTSGIKELLRINGVRTWMIYASWFIMFGLITAMIALIVTITWKWPLENGAVLAFTNPFILFIILVNYYWCALASVGFISSFITEPRYGMLFIVLYWIGSNIFVDEMTTRFRNGPMLVFLALLPNGGIHGILEAISQFEAGGSGATFSNLYTSPPVPTLIFPIGVNMALMALGTIVYLILMTYVDAIKPGPYGRAKPWNFIFPRCSKVQAERTALLSDHRDAPSKALMEEVDKDTPVGLQAAKLSKVFGSLRAVDNLNLTFYKNQITALLGHNGAGKSTLFSMISGMYSPTSGTVYTEDFDIFIGNNIEMFRRQLGFCPQHDLLIDELTVEQHLLFFGMLKGLTKEEAKVQSDHWTDKFKLQDGRHKMVAELSGGMKRKLCLSIALAGNPRFLLLDEPTSGLDPESRRDIWDVLLTVRGNRTIIISTHFMEEADVLGDRIAIVAHGTLKCFGTGMFLKKHYGSGYQLNITMKNDVDGLKDEIARRIPNAVVVNETNKLLSICLPSSEVRKFPDLFQTIEQKYSKDIESSLSCTTMDDVFLKVQESEGVQMTVDEVDMPTMLKETQDRRSRQSELSRIFQQMEGFIIKRYKWAFYNWPSFLFFIVICPILGMYLNMAGCNHAQEQRSNEKLKLTLEEYEGSLAFIAKQNGPDRLASIFEAAITGAGSSFMEIKSSENMSQALLDAASADLLKYRSQMAVAFDTRGQPLGMFSTLPYHSLPIAYGMLSNALIKLRNSSATITTYSFPYNFNKGECTIGLDPASIQMSIMWIIFGAWIGMVTSYFVMFPHTERITFVKHLQIMTGAHPLVYWLTNFIADLTLFILSIILSMIVLVLMDKYDVFTYCLVLGVLALVTLLFGMGAIFFAYFCSYFFKTYTSSMELNIFLCWIIAAVSAVGSLFESTAWAVYLFNFIPWVPYVGCLIKIVTWAMTARRCSTCASQQICKLLLDNASIESFGMKTELIYLAVDPFVFLLLILMIDHGLFRWLMTHVRSCLYGPIIGSSEAADLDVTTEKEAVDAARANVDGSTPPIFVCDDLGKKFSRSFTAVYDVTFAIQKGECFGLLGVNGAGKSTTFGMLTGNIAPTRGDARLLQYSISHHKYNYMKRLGYCPQLDGLLPEMSARTQLSLFGRLRGIPSSELDNITQKWIDALDMTDICDRPCKEYSGGNKRKLSTAMALIADPPVVLLDEPTTGVDPVVRRKIWSILKYCRQVNGQTIIITSHSMDECEAVCGRLTIMVKGLMKCIGTIPRLKKVYGKGYVLLVKLQFKCTQEEANVVKSEVLNRFNPFIRLQDEQFGLFNFHVNSEHVKLDKMFEIMNGLKSAYSIIEDFSLSDISLEQVFLSLAKGSS